MSQADITVVSEYNYQPPKKNAKGIGSVWLFPGDGSSALEDDPTDHLHDRDDHFSVLPGWVKLVGPIGYDEAIAIADKLTDVLRAAGVEVLSDSVTD